ncbi:hypothetical protein CesoFtcFv8_019980 [Champsocephalus esox]|uniref:Uncharacterized protein n=2 Tax=Champsocephalus TaxID=52236 RepID=A0AAN8D0L3_CHAGU|nr:hypothetical protein CesoFtcFv8_019980 [Champsocephalus esox]KAK5911268.1 hypothetical protein CgunFtcFv8_005462 [Champsocephalus gunnari]
MESGHALSSHPPQGWSSPRIPPQSKALGAVRGGAVMDGRTPTPEDDCEAEKDRLQTQMGFDTDSELVPCHLMGGGKREIWRGEGKEKGGLGSLK